MTESTSISLVGSLSGSGAVATLSMLSTTEIVNIAKLFGIFGTFGLLLSLVFCIHIAFIKPEHLSLRETLGRSFLAFGVSSISGVTAFYYTGEALPSVIISAISGFLAEKVTFLIPSILNGLYFKIFGIELSDKTLEALEITKDEETNMKQIMLENLEKDGFMSKFYEFLFSQDPSLKKRFKMDEEERYSAVKSMLRLIIIYMDRLDDEHLTTTLKPIACRHAEKYNTSEEDFVFFGIALIETLEYFGVPMNKITKQKWMKNYEKLSDLMKKLGNV